MALYAHSIHLFRESSRGSVADSLRRVGLLTQVGGEFEMLGLGAAYSEFDGAHGLTELTLAPDDDTFAEFTRTAGAKLVAWLLDAVEQADVLYGFIPAEGDARHAEDGVDTEALARTQLPELVSVGRVRVVHPLMLFSARLARGVPYRKAQTFDWGVRVNREGVGCVLALAETTATGFELLEPGTMYPVLRNQWRADESDA